MDIITKFKILTIPYNYIQFILFPTYKEGRCLINGFLYRRGRGILQLGDGVRINSSRRSNPLGGASYTTLYIYRGAQLIIGKNTGISNSIIIAKEKIQIEDNVLIGAGCKIYDNDFHSMCYEERINGTDNPLVAPIFIRRGSFIGAHSIILKGVEIGEESVVGAGSVVTRNIPSNELWAGNPAKFVRKLT